MSIDTYYKSAEADVEMHAAVLFEMKCHPGNEAAFYAEYKNAFCMECAYMKSYFDYQTKIKNYLMPEFSEDETITRNPVAYLTKLRMLYTERTALEDEFNDLEIKMMTHLTPLKLPARTESNSEIRRAAKEKHVFKMLVSAMPTSVFSIIYNLDLVAKKDLYATNMIYIRNVNKIFEEILNVPADQHHTYMANMHNNELYRPFIENLSQTRDDASEASESSEAGEASEENSGGEANES